MFNTGVLVQMFGYQSMWRLNCKLRRVSFKARSRVILLRDCESATVGLSLRLSSTFHSIVWEDLHLRHRCRFLEHVQDVKKLAEYFL